jgi:ceramide glucosyltransferase
MLVISGLLALLVAGSLAYCALIIWASRSYLKARSSARTGDTPPISVLKPLCGHDQGLEDNLRSFFEQDYPVFELLAGVHRADDPAVAVFEQIKSEYPEHTEARLIVTGESPVPNAKAFSLKRLVRESRYDLLVMGDSDIRVKPDVLKRLAGEFANADVGLVTCPYRAVSGPSLWSHLEAIGMNTEFLGGVLVARMIEGMKFALGCVVAVRRNVLDAMGGFQYLQDYLAEDFIMGQRAAELGHKVLLSSCVIEHHIGSQDMRKSLSHRLRWARSTRRSRPAGYWGQIFTYPLPCALLLWAANDAAWPVVLLTMLLRAGAAWTTSSRVLGSPLTFKQWLLLPLQDLLGFLVWMGGFLGDTVVWRDRKCTIMPDGRLEMNQREKQAA